MMKEQKPVAERIKESITILHKLEEWGIKREDSGQIEVRKHMNDWIKTEYAIQTRIDFPLHERRAELLLPVKAGCIATCNLKHHKFY